MERIRPAHPGPSERNPPPLNTALLFPSPLQVQPSALWLSDVVAATARPPAPLTLSEASTLVNALAGCEEQLAVMGRSPLGRADLTALLGGLEQRWGVQGEGEGASWV